MSEKYYELATYNEAQFDELFLEITGTASSPDTIPDRAVENTEYFQHSPVRGEFLLTDDEAEALKTDARIKYVQLSPDKYPDIFNATEDDLRMDITGDAYERYDDPVKNYHFWANNGAILGSFGSGAADLNHASGQLLRMGQYRNNWISSGTSTTTPISDTITQKGAGENVDVICADNGTWIGHVEFINTGVTNAVNPTDYVGGNVLPGNGYCDVLDVILDGPYYIDPDWFDADPDNRLTTRWDGTTVPVESVARNWWGNSTQRSAAFSSIGTVTISSFYTRDAVHGSNTTYPTSATATHGTQCASLIYGRTHGWAYNCNKWHLNLYGNSNAGTIERGFDIVKLFHQNKPNNSTYGTKDPTLMSNSWGYRANKTGTHYYHRNSGPVAYPGSSDEPEFIRYMGVDGDSGRWKSEFFDNSMTQAGEELTDSGVIFVAAAGNSGQKQVNPDHPDYDNRIASNNTDGLYEEVYSSFGYSVTGTTNRRGFPQHIGKSVSQSFKDDDVDFPAINVGALDDVFNGSKERKVNYSDMGNAIDIYAPADGTLAATVGLYGTDVARYDDTYDDLSVTYDCRDTRFSGTSAACPVACGFLATIMQYNRGWTYSDLRSWIQTNVQSVDTDEFHVGTEETDPEGSGWADRTLPQAQSSEVRVLYLADFDISTPNPTLTKTVTFGGNIAFRNGVIFKRRST
jgi:hypothetical protein